MQIKFVDVYFSYNNKTPFKSDALKNINLLLNDNEMIAIVGETGSGKSTLAELIDAFITPTSGALYIDNFLNKTKAHHKNSEVMNLRKRIGFLFQFSENQLFMDSVLKEVGFGIKNFDPKNKDIDALSKEALTLVGLDESFYNRSPFDLSGGEKKKVAIASVISYKPQLLILDEPTSGLDQKAKNEMMDLFKKINQRGVKIIFITHDMEIAFNYANKIVVLNEGEIKALGKPKDILKNEVETYHLKTPNIYKVMFALSQKGMKLNQDNVNDIYSLVKEIKRIHG